jgi:hypothetical protein
MKIRNFSVHENRFTNLTEKSINKAQPVMGDDRVHDRIIDVDM